MPFYFKTHQKNNFVTVLVSYEGIFIVTITCFNAIFD
jgi:hypothetical protein